MNEVRVNGWFGPDPMADAFRTLLRPWRSGVSEPAPSIKLDLIEAEGSYTVKAEMPGLRKEDITVRIQGNQVIISAEVKGEPAGEKAGRVIRSERRYGHAGRALTLSSDVDEARAEATYRDGVLKLSLPKKTTTSSKRLPIG